MSADQPPRDGPPPTQDSNAPPPGPAGNPGAGSVTGPFLADAEAPGGADRDKQVTEAPDHRPRPAARRPTSPATRSSKNWGAGAWAWSTGRGRSRPAGWWP
jgi:hypothetical protein